ncbi:hypothetical protein [Mycolicibacterium farcinogenes]|nr:hypothetical protein [Mycolicibacterium farcinogenes]
MSESDCSPMVVMSYGMGVDSTAILLRWFTEPSTRDFDLRDLVVIAADTGGEFDETIRDVEEVVLPELSRRGVRFIQVGRSQRKTSTSGEGVAVLQDSTAPKRLYGAAYTLEDELLSAGTLPQIGGTRLCSIHAKGNCLDPVIATVTAGRSYRHVVGFESGEPSRAVKDALFNTDQRTGWYPLQDWGWDRAQCTDFITQITGRRWSKSACGFCPFAMTTEAGRRDVVERWRREPHQGARALFLEDVARRLNERQTLIQGSSAAALAAQANLEDVERRFQATLDGCEHAIYEVRRLTRRSSKRPDGCGTVARSVRATKRGTRQEMSDALALAPGVPRVGGDGILRHIVRQRTAEKPDLEHFYVVCPAVVEDKQRAGFEQWWQEATTDAVLF